MKTVAVATLTSLTALGANANPLNPTVVGGSASVTQSGNTLTVNQTSQRAAIDWQSFNIGAGETTSFVQPNSSAVALNRVWGPGASTIAGRLLANGHLIVVNPSGIVFTPTSFVNVAGLVATTSNITNANFMAGNMIFDQPGDPWGSVTNSGTITVAEGGLAAFVAPFVRNAGTIEAKLGKISLASGTKFTVDFYGDGLVNLAVDAAMANFVGMVDSGGSIAADGGTILMSVAAAREIVNGTINLYGFARARSATHEGGKIILRGGQGTVNVAGGAADAREIDVSAGKIVFQPGGFLQATGQITLRTNNQNDAPPVADTPILVSDVGSSGSTSLTLKSGSSIMIAAPPPFGGSPGWIVVTGGKETTGSADVSTTGTTISATAVPPFPLRSPPSSVAAGSGVSPNTISIGTVSPNMIIGGALFPIGSAAVSAMSIGTMSFTNGAVDPFATAFSLVETGPQSGAFRDLPYFRDGLWTGGGR